MIKLIVIIALGSQLITGAPAVSQISGSLVCDTVFKRPTYPTRQAFCTIGERVEDAYSPGTFYPCEEMEVDHLVSLRYAHRNGVCDPADLRRLANDRENLRLTYWRTNRAKGTLSAEEFATKRLSPDVAERVIQDATELRGKFNLAAIDMTPEVRSRWLIEERDVLQRENNRLIELADTFRDEQIIYRGKKMRAAEAVSHHAARVSRRITVSSLRNLGSMAAEALPFVGVAAIAGVTAMELHDACEALKDTHELDIAFNPSSVASDDVKTVCSINVPSQDELTSSIKESPSRAWEAAKAYTPTLPDLRDLKIDWGEHLSLIKAGADWIISETSATTASFLSTVATTFGKLRLPWP